MHGVECCFALPLGSVMLHRTYLDFSSRPFFMVAEHSCKSQTMHADCAWFIFSHFATIWLWNAHMLVIAVQGLIRTKSIMFLLAYLAWSHMLDTWGIGAQHVRFSTLCTQCHNETFGHVEWQKEDILWSGFLDVSAGHQSSNSQPQLQPGRSKSRQQHS